MRHKIYAGIGSRKTPPHILEAMKNIAHELGNKGWLLRSGHAIGADQAFETGARVKEVHLPWRKFNNAPTNNPFFLVPKATPGVCEIARLFYKYWDTSEDAVKLLMCRNTTIVLGEHLDMHARMVICWTKDGTIQGGTGQAMRIAQAYDIPIFNLWSREDQQKLCDFIKSIENDQ